MGFNDDFKAMLIKGRKKKDFVFGFVDDYVKNIIANMREISGDYQGAMWMHSG